MSGIPDSHFTVMPAGLVTQSPHLDQDFFQTLPLNELHDVVVDTIVLTDAKDRDNVGVVQAGRGARFMLEAFLLLLIDQQPVRKYFQCHTTSKRFLFGFIDDAHPATAYFAQDAVITQHGRWFAGS